MNAKKYTKSTYIEKQVDYFKRASSKEPKLLGMEFEHHLIDVTTLRSYDYFEENGQKQMMARLKANGWAVLQEEEGNILGLVKNGSTITLEPGGQVEISLKPFDQVDMIQREYEHIIAEIYEVLAPGQALASIGYHPKTKISELSLLPKKRYHMMYDYFKDAGAFCHNMMKGTCATQVSIDYKDEQDFIRKFRVANFLAPALASLFDSTPIFEGELECGRHMRTRIWSQTDIRRSKLIPNSLTKQFGFSDYAAYILSLPPILLYSEGQLLSLEKEILEHSLDRYAFTDEELEHHLSMVFPDVRLKKFIEIRMPDALPYPYNLAVSALIKAIFYHEETLEKYYLKSLEVDDQWVIAQNKALISGMQSLELQSMMDDLLCDAIEVLPANEASILQSFKAVITEWGSFTAYLRHLAQTDVQAFSEAIVVKPST